MPVTSQLPIQTTKIFYTCFDVHLCPHFDKGSAMHGSTRSPVPPSFGAGAGRHTNYLDDVDIIVC